MPKRSRIGVVSSPERVVAPTSVKGARSRRKVRAPGPCPITMSIAPSSIAGYSSSSMARGSRCTSSTNSTSFGSSAVRIEAMSPLRSRAGPEIVWIRLSISIATMKARLVLPRPGGPASRTWSHASPRPRAAATKVSNWRTACSWPTQSPSRCGRSEPSTSRSSGSSSPAMIRASSLISDHPRVGRGPP